MKLVLAVVAIYIATCAGAPSINAESGYDNHYISHKDSLHGARRQAMERLQQGDDPNIQQFAVDYGAESANEAASGNGESAHGESRGDIGLTGLTTGVAVDPALCVVPCDGHSIGGASSTSKLQIEAESQSGGGPVFISLPGGGSSSKIIQSSSRREETRQASPPVIIPVPSGHSERRVNHFERITESKSNPVPIVYPVFSPSSRSESSFRRSERIEQAPQIQIPIYQPGGRSERISSRSERIVSQSTPQIQIPIYQPSGRSERISSSFHKISQGSTAPVQIQYYPSGNSQRIVSKSQRIEESRAPQYHPIIYYPSGGSSSSLISHEEYLRQNAALQPIIQAPALTTSCLEESSFSHQKIVNNQVNPCYVPYAPSIGGSSSLQQLSQQSSSSQGGYGGYGVYGGYGGHGGYGGGGFNSGYSGYFGSQTGSGLSQYMSESERLAREQAQQVQGSGTYSGSSLLDSHDSFSGGQYGSGGSVGGAGGYNNVKSWESSSKFASGTQYDASGRPKTYSSLSTAEGENHNVNGKSTSFRAATTTLEDDGKVSTYSIHT